MAGKAKHLFPANPPSIFQSHGSEKLRLSAERLPGGKPPLVQRRDKSPEWDFGNRSPAIEEDIEAVEESKRKKFIDTIKEVDPA